MSRVDHKSGTHRCSDPQNKVERIALEYKVTMNRRIILREMGDLDYVFSIIRQSYQNVL